jgi:AraC-like DNA-binding protein
MPSPTPAGARFDIRTIAIDDPLGRWAHNECRVPHLARFVEFIWHFDGRLACRRERTFPSGLLEIIVHLGERYHVVDGDRLWSCPVTCLTGLQLQPLVVEAPDCRTVVMGIRLTPAGAFALAGTAMPGTTGYTVDLEDLCGAAGRELADRCGAARGATACFETAVNWLERRFAAARPMDPAAGWAASEIRRRRGAVPIATLQESTGFSRARFVDLFRRHVGTTPKQYARVVRFRHLLDRLPGLRGSLAEAAAESGYYDQPHMNGEFKALSGFTPTEFLASRRYPHSVSVAE